MSKSYREIMERYRAQSLVRDHRTDQPGQMPPAPENLCLEVYNQGDEEIIFKSTHPEWHKMAFFDEPPEYWRELVVKPGDWGFLPHQMYTAFTRSGRPGKYLKTRGGDMFKGAKLPSRPEVAKIRSFVPGVKPKVGR